MDLRVVYVANAWYVRKNTARGPFKPVGEGYGRRFDAVRGAARMMANLNRPGKIFVTDRTNNVLAVYKSDVRGNPVHA